MGRSGRTLRIGLACLLASCASPQGGSPSAVTPAPAASDTYIKRVAVRDAFRDAYLMHWPVREMPLAVYLPPPPADLFADPDAVQEAVRSAVLAWTDVVRPGVPAFRFVDVHGEADVPILWADEPDGDWYIAFCSFQVNPRSNLFDVEHLLVTGRWGDGRQARTDEIHEVVLHEMGHALGLLGHSEDPADVMYPSLSGRTGSGLSDRDRRTLRELYSRGNRMIRGARGQRYR